jgi:glycine cleavage system regulatory protein
MGRILLYSCDYKIELHEGIMNNYYLLWALGPDHPGLVSSVTKLLYEYDGNLEDSSMMRLGSEFGIFLIFSSSKKLSDSFSTDLKKLEFKTKLNIGVNQL